MKIGLFGDSYVDLRGNRAYPENPEQQRKLWSWQLLNELSSVIDTSGHGGTDQYHAIKQWQERPNDYDYAIFTFTWYNRIYLDIFKQEVSSAWAEKREVNLEFLQNSNVDPDMLTKAIDLYYRHMFDHDNKKFLFELMVKYCLDLPKQYPETKFIFLPNTEISREMAKKYFSKGVLVDFAFETLSNREPNSPGIMPCSDARSGHLNTQNHRLFKEYIKNIIVNYDSYENQIVEFDYSKFDVV